MIFSTFLTLLCAVADTTYSDWENQGIDLDQVVVTATRTPKMLSESPIQTLLIPSSDIRRLDVSNVEELLKQELPGVEFSYSMNMQVNMNMSGFAGQSVLFLVDGERLAGETNDNVDFDRLVTSGIDHIEIVKGAASALYGSSANGGVINIITTDPSRLPKWSMNLHGRYGSHGENRYGLDLGLHQGIWSNTLNVQHNGLDCYQVHNRSNAPIPLRIDYVPGQDMWNVSDRLVCQPSDKLRFTGRLGFYRREMIRHASESEHTRYYDYTAGLRGDWEASDVDHLEVSYHFDQYDKTRYYIPSTTLISDCNVREYSNVQNSVRALWNHQYEGAVLTVGADYLYDYLINNKLADADYHQFSADAFLQYDWNISRQWELIGALRYDYFDIGHRSQLTPKLSAAWHHGRLNVRGGYAMGFRAPTLKELYYDFEAMTGWVIDGNPDLTPEYSHNVTLSADYTRGHYNFNLMAYYNRILDRITTGVPRSLSDGAHLPYVNLPEVDVAGGEASVQARWNNGLGAKLSYCYTNEHNPDQAPNQFMPARPHSCNYRVDYERSLGEDYSFCVSLSGRYLSSVRNREYRSTQHPEAGILSVHYPAYHLHKFQLIQHWRRLLTITFAIDNLLGYKPDNYYYNAPLTTGQSYSIGASVRF